MFNKNNILFVLAVIFSGWFILTSWLWVYLFALFIAYPAALIGLALWLTIKKDGKKRNKAIPILLIIGIITSITGFLVTYFNN